MKTLTTNAILLLAATSLVASNIKIGIFSLPCRFEDDNLSDIVRYVVTNDVQSFCTPISAFHEPYQDKSGHICVQRINTPGTTLYRPTAFMDGIKFFIENGQTNCIIRQSLTDTAKALESELPTRTNLVCKAQQFIDAIMSGSITNKTIAELRLLTRVYENGTLRIANQNDGPDDVVIQNFIDLKNDAVFYPLSVLDASWDYVGSNRVFILKARYDTPNEPSYKREISVFPLIYADGYWSLCL